MNSETTRSNQNEEIFLPEETIRMMSQSNFAFIQVVQFNFQGTLVALGCKNGTILIMDFLTMSIVRVFSLHQDFGLPANEDVDQFIQFLKLSNFYEEDILLKVADSKKELDLFLQNKYAERKQKDAMYEEPPIIKMESKSSLDGAYESKAPGGTPAQ